MSGTPSAATPKSRSVASCPVAPGPLKAHLRPWLIPVAVALRLLAYALPASGDILPPDRSTAWSPGLPGGIPVRATVCATVNASTYGNGSSDASAGIQAALDACPVGQVVQLSAGTFTVNRFLAITKGITLRGAGAGATTLQKTNGAVPGSYNPPDAQPIIIIGPNRWPSVDETTARNLTADGVKGTLSVTVSSGTGFTAGQFALLDEDDYYTGAWTALPNRYGSPTADKIWATDRVVWQRHNPTDPGADDPFPDALGWFSRPGRPVNEIKEIASVSGNVVAFTTPIHITYRSSHTAQLTRYTGQNAQVRDAGVEDLKVTGGSDGAIRFEAAAYSWVKGIEDTVWLGEGVAINHSFRCVLRDSYIHDGAWPAPGGGGYAISLADGSAEALIENNIILKANKVMVARSSGAGSVVGYNYADDGFINYNEAWQEVGINGSHMVGPHHMLFEGNESFNYDSDNTHGSAIYHTVFRNHLTGFRRDFPGLDNGRTSGLAYGSYWHSFVGNVLGISGQMGNWIYEDPGDGTLGNAWGGQPNIWRLGYDPIHWEQSVDPMVRSTVLREGNFDYVTNSVRWDSGPQALPDSLYLAAKPDFFGSYTWPWVDPIGATKLYTLPARARYDAGNPNGTPANRFTLSVVKSGTGSGSVTSLPTGISCGAACSASYDAGTLVVLTAIPDVGSAFGGWSGACSGSLSCQVTMSVAQSVAATFVASPINYILSVGKAGTGSGTVTSSPAAIDCGANCAASYLAGTLVTLTATPAAGSAFSGWSGACSGTGSCLVTMSAAGSVTASFALIPVSYSLNVSTSGTGGGTVTSAPSGINCGATCAASYNGGTVVSLTAAPAVGSVFSGWSGACSGTPSCQVTMNAITSVAANFTVDPSTYTLSVTKAGTGTGTVTSLPAGVNCGAACSATYAASTVVTLSVAPAAGSTFAGWSGACSGTSSCQVTMGAANAVTASFAVSAGGLVAAWGFNEGTGTTTGDSSPNGNTGTLVNGPTWTTGRYGRALLFDGINDRVRVNDSNSLDLTTAATFEAWVYPTVAPSGWRTIIQKEVDAYFFTASGGPRATSGGTFNGACCTYVVSSSALPVNTWTHLAATYDGTRLRFYVNGNLAASLAVTGSYEVNASPLWIGGNAVYGEHFKGKLDELRIYNRALTPAEIQQDMALAIP